jgi:hypothetical protein
MNNQNKLIKINNNKIELNSLIKNALHKIKNNITNINNLLTKSNKLIKIIEMIKIFDINNWSLLKKNYNKIKSRVTKDKKIYYNIIKLYNKIITYYTDDELNDINDTISNIYNLNQSMLYNFIILRKNHNNVKIKIMNYYRNNHIIKINNVNENDINIVDNLINNIIIIDNKLYLLKKQKAKIIYDIKNIIKLKI